MTAVAIAVLGVLLVLALLFIVALLRSHAEILRRLALLEESLDAGGVAVPGDGSLSRSAARPDAAAAGTGLSRPTGRGGPAADIAGETLDGDAVRLSLGPRSPRTLLAFLSSGCASCAPLWEELPAGGGDIATGTRVVAITKGPERERTARLLELAPGGADVVMSSRAWEQYGVGATPHFVLVDRGEIAGRGSATSWEQIAGFLADAEADDRVHRDRSGREREPRDGGGGRSRPLGTNARAARAEQALASAGIEPGDGSLYPSRAGGADA